MPYDPRHHHRRSVRLPAYDYSQWGAYFFTVCSHDRECLFGEIRGGIMCLSDAGSIVWEQWYRTAELRPAAVLGPFVVMPNHVNGILGLNPDLIAKDTVPRAPTVERLGKPTSNSLPTIVRSFKAAVTRILKMHPYDTPKIWQRGFHDHVVRDEEEYNRIARYILTNIEHWNDDRFYHS